VTSADHGRFVRHPIVLGTTIDDAPADLMVQQHHPQLNIADNRSSAEKQAS
jgi:hypothetical protein